MHDKKCGKLIIAETGDNQSVAREQNRMCRMLKFLSLISFYSTGYVLFQKCKERFTIGNVGFRDLGAEALTTIVYYLAFFFEQE